VIGIAEALLQTIHTRLQSGAEVVHYSVRQHTGETMTTITATEARRNLYRLVDDVSESHQPVHISGKRHSAVLIAEEDWSALQETLHLTSIPGMKESIVEGLNTPVEKCRKELDW
jgi:prevent-host-death family protein